MFLIIQTGDPVPLAKLKYGSFAEWFINGLEITAEQTQVVDVHQGQSLPDIHQAKDKLTAIVITGSAAMVTNKDPWLLSTQGWLTQMIPHNIPILGVCYGHQVLVDLLGGQVAYNPKGRNMGLNQFNLNNQATTDALFQHLPTQTSTFASHMQSVIQLPNCATLLGTCELDENHAFRAEEVLWGVQFHPEWNQQIMQAYIQSRHDDLIAEGFNPIQMVKQLKPCHAAYALLSQFSRLAKVKRKALIEA